MSQSEIIELLQKTKKWMTVKQIKESFPELGNTTVGSCCRRMRKRQDIEFRKVSGYFHGYQFEYHYNPNKMIR